jgi:ABC-2 type transport system ATP-binding protein
MSTAVEVTGVHRAYGSTAALAGVSTTVREGAICGLLGRNGAGKTTLLSVIAGQERPSSGAVRTFGHDPVESVEVLSRTSFVRDSQRWPDDFRIGHVLSVAPAFHAGWDPALARDLVADLRVPTRTPIKKMSRGQASSVAIVLGLASRAPLTIFDEPYLGLDATARQTFYDRLLVDYAEHPRTVLLSTHLVDESESLLEQVVVLDEGRVVLDTDVDTARASAWTAAGAASAVDRVVGSRRVLARHALGGLASVTVAGAPDDVVRREARAAGVELGSVSLQQFVAALGAGAPSPGMDDRAVSVTIEGALS